MPGPSMPPRSNGLGHPQHTAVAGGRGSSIYEDDWDEDVLIGGKRMPGWMEEEEGKREVESLGRLLEGMET